MSAMMSGQLGSAIRLLQLAAMHHVHSFIARQQKNTPPKHPHPPTLSHFSFSGSTEYDVNYTDIFELMLNIMVLFLPLPKSLLLSETDIL